MFATPIVVQDITDGQTLLWLGVHGDPTLALCVTTGGSVYLWDLSSIRVLRPTPDFPPGYSFSAEQYAALAQGKQP